MKEVIAIFDIGKTNKKFLLFDEQLQLVFQEEVQFEELTDDDGFACDDIAKLEAWIPQRLKETIRAGQFRIKAINFATYGASLVYLDARGKRLTPVYNYLKTMPVVVMYGFYEQYGRVEAFCRETASPAMGMLNSGLQIRWLKATKPAVFAKVSTILHFPQYLSYCLTGSIVSELTSIGCHTALWDFDQQRYHRWLFDEGIQLPDPIPNDTLFEVQIEGQTIRAGIGIHDSSASLVPYFRASNEPFILVSTGTWCIFMHPFNNEALTTGQLRNDTLCYLSIQQQQVKASRLFMGHIHDVNVPPMANFFGLDDKASRQVAVNEALLKSYLQEPAMVFFREGIPADYLDEGIDYAQFESFDEAYHRFMFDLV
ncbi:MAG: carbohydrate kinase, partial [Prolixibacteraceae bacterium]|nr:carbohydrate kinase [Prolixibacteraceae bacterium]